MSMKPWLRLFILLSFFTAFTACDGGADGEDVVDAATDETSVASQYMMTALVDSVPWTATSIDTREELGTIYITGIAADGSQIVLELGEKPKVGIFPMRRGSGQAGTYMNKEGSKYYAPFAGTMGVINITEYAKDSLLKANFNFSSSNTMDMHLIEDGSFIAPIHQNAGDTAQ